MTSAADDQALGGLVEQVEARERSARRRTLLFTLVPIIVATLLLAYISNRIREYNQELDKLRAELEATENQLAAADKKLGVTEEKLAVTEKQLAQAERQLKATTSLAKYAHPVELTDMKSASSSLNSDGNAIMFEILFAAEDKVNWKLNGRTPSEGFDSPGFAYYMLTDGISTNLVDRIEPEESAREHLCGKLPRVAKPRPGDLACYLGGFTMFYFEDSKGEPFVIGMTPKGVVALEPDFAGSPEYHSAGLSGE